MSKPTKCTPELIEKLCSKLRKGLAVKTACTLVGIGESTYYDWLDRATLGEEPFDSFRSALFIAEAEAEEWWVDVLHSATCDKTINPNPAYFWLERRRRNDWGRQIQVDNEVKFVTADDILKEMDAE